MDIKRISEQEVNDILQKEDIDLSSFEVRSTLNPKIFDKEQHMHEDVRRRLLMIADDFFETLNVGWVDIDDIILTGSLANFNWSKFSDVDLHILVDFGEVDENEELVKEYFNSKKNLWNEKHDITIKGYDVELYMQDTEEPHVSSGVYSILWDGWVVQPDSTKKEIDSKKVEQKVNNIIVPDLIKLPPPFHSLENQQIKIAQYGGCGVQLRRGDFLIGKTEFSQAKSEP